MVRGSLICEPINFLRGKLLAVELKVGLGRTTGVFIIQAARLPQMQYQSLLTQSTLTSLTSQTELLSLPQSYSIIPPRSFEEYLRVYTF